MFRYNPTRPMDNPSIRQRQQKAEQHICDLDAGRRRWTMSIPHNFAWDSDRIFGESLDDIEYLLSENAQRLSTIAKLEQDIDRLRQMVAHRDAALAEYRKRDEERHP